MFLALRCEEAPLYQASKSPDLENLGFSFGRFGLLLSSFYLSVGYGIAVFVGRRLKKQALAGDADAN